MLWKISWIDYFELFLNISSNFWHYHFFNREVAHKKIFYCIRVNGRGLCEDIVTKVLTCKKLLKMSRTNRTSNITLQIHEENLYNLKLYSKSIWKGYNEEDMWRFHKTKNRNVWITKMIKHVLKHIFLKDNGVGFWRSK